MKKINIIQFMPYFPPHKGGLETHAEQWGNWWVKKGFGKVYNIVTSFEQSFSLGEEIIFEGIVIGYKKNGVENLIVPSFEVVTNFPIYKTWTKEYKSILKYLEDKDLGIVISRTRFFTTSLVGGIYARNNKIKWCHIEHGSDYVKLSSEFKNFVAKVYDKLIGKWIFKKADILMGVSNACKDFIQNEFVNREVSVIYRGIEVPSKNEINITQDLKQKFPGKIIVGFLGRIYKWKNVESLIEAYYDLDDNIKDKFQLMVVGDGEDLDRLKNLDKDNVIYFTGGKALNEAIELQSQFDIHFHTSSPGGGLATTLLQAMNLGCFIVSTPYEGAKEVIIDGYNGLLLNDDSISEFKEGLKNSISELEKREEFARKNKEIIDKDFVWNINIEKYYNLFK